MTSLRCGFRDIYNIWRYVEMRQIYGYPVPNIDERLDVRVFKCLNDLEGR